MTRPIIAIDIDDVIADTTESLRLAANSRYGGNLQSEDYVIDADYWGYYERVWKQHGLHNANYDELHQEMATDQSHVPLMPGANFAIGELSKNNDIIVVTARDPLWEKTTLEWLKQHFGEVFSSVHFAGRSKNGNQVKTKGLLCSELGAELLIDDNVEHCQSALDVGVSAILFGNYGWHNGKAGGLTNCKDWPAVLDYLNERS